MFINNQILSTDLSTGIPQRRSVFAIIVHFGSKEITDAAIASLKTSSLRPDHIIVIDHDSPERNTGYAAGLIEGLEEAVRLGAKESDLCVLMNNDSKFNKDSLRGMYDWWSRYGGPRVLAGAAGGYVSLFSGKAHIESEVIRKTPWNIPYVHGSCFIGECGLLSSSVLPPTFFMYWEDVVASIRVQELGGTLAVVPGLTGIHSDGVTQVSNAKLFYMVRNGAYVLEQLTSPSWRVYWRVVNNMRRVYHGFYGDERHALIVKALKAARVGELGKVDV